MSQPYLSRAALDAACAAFYPTDAPEEVREQFLAADIPTYPMSTDDMCRELRRRWLDVDRNAIHALIRGGHLDPPPGPGRSVKWSAEDVDRAAVALCEAGRLKPIAQVCAALGIAGDGWLRAETAARLEHGIGADTGAMQIIITPPSSWRAKNATATVEFRKVR